MRRTNLAEHLGLGPVFAGASIEDMPDMAHAEVAKLRAREKPRGPWTGITNAEPVVLTRELLEETARKMQMAPRTMPEVEAPEPPPVVECRHTVKSPFGATTMFRNPQACAFQCAVCGMRLPDHITGWDPTKHTKGGQ